MSKQKLNQQKKQFVVVLNEFKERSHEDTERLKLNLRSLVLKKC